MFAINEINIPKAAIPKPIISNTFNLINVTAKYKKIRTFMKCEKTKRAPPYFHFILIKFLLFQKLTKQLQQTPISKL
jgi:hypothetical protein